MSILQVSEGKNVVKALFLGIFVVVLLTLMQCATKNASVASLPKDILGISVGMSKENAEQHLREIGKFMREESKRQQVWILNNNLSFGYIALGYDENNQVRYVTAIAKPKDGKPMFFKDIGDLSAAKEEIAGPNYRYTWQVPANENNSGYAVTAQGANAEFLSLYTLSKPNSSEKESEEESKEREEK